MATVIGALRYDIVADTSKFTAGMALSRKELAAGKRIMEATTTDAELMGNRMQQLDRLLKAGAITHRAYNRAVADLRASEAAEKQEALNQRIKEGQQITQRAATAEEQYAAEVRDLRTHLAAGTISQQTYNRSVQSLQSKLPAVQRAEQARAQAMQQTEQWTRRLENSSERYQRELLELNQAYRAGHVSQQLYNRGLDNLERQYQQTSRAASMMHGAGQRVNRIFDVAAGNVMAMGVMHVGQALRGSVRSNEEFQQAMATSLAIAGNVSAGMREQLTTAAQQIAFNTKFSSTEAASSIEFLQLAGLSLEQSLATMPQVAKFAQAGMFDLAIATDLATDAQAAMGLDSTDTQKHLLGMANVTDVLTKASVIANARIEQFAAAITSGAGPAARQVGMDIEETTAVLAAFARTGFAKGEEAGTQFGIVMRDLQTKAIQNKQAFAEAGIAVFDASGDFQKMSGIIGDVEKHLAGMSDEQQKATLLQLGFSDKSVKSIQALLGQSEAIAEYEQKLREAGGTTDEVASKQLPSLTAALQQLQATWQVFTEIGVNPIVESFAQTDGTTSRFTEFLSGVLDAMEMIQKGWYYINLGIDASGLAVKGLTGSILTMVLRPLEMIETLIGVLESLGVAPEFATEAAEKISSMRGAVAGSFDTTKDWQRLSREADEFDKRFGGQSAGDRFRARMAQVSAPLATVPAGQGTPEASAAKATADAGSMMQNVLPELRSVVVTQEQANRNSELMRMTLEQLQDAVMDGQITESEYDRLAGQTRAAQDKSVRLDKPAALEKQAAITSASRGSAEAYRIITEMMRAQKASGKEDKLIEATEEGNEHLAAIGTAFSELNEKLGSVQ